MSYHNDLLLLIAGETIPVNRLNIKRRVNVYINAYEEELNNSYIEKKLLFKQSYTISREQSIIYGPERQPEWHRMIEDIQQTQCMKLLEWEKMINNNGPCTGDDKTTHEEIVLFMQGWLANLDNDIKRGDDFSYKSELCDLRKDIAHQLQKCEDVWLEKKYNSELSVDI